MKRKIALLSHGNNDFIEEDENIILISSLHDFQLFLTQENNLENLAGFIVLGELKWGKRYFTDFEGLNIIYKIRLEYNLKNPIIITSFIPSIEIRNIGNAPSPLFRFLKDPSIIFIPIEDFYSLTLSEIYKKFPPAIIDEMLLEDIAISLYNKNGFISSFIYETLNEVLYDEKTFTKERAKQFIIEKQNRISKFNLDSNIQQTLNESFQQLLTTENFHSSKIITSFFQKILTTISVAQPIENLSLSPIEALYIGNDNDLKSLVLAKLTTQGIRFSLAINSEEAIKILRENTDIKVVVCDYRFYNYLGQFSREQGYHIIKKISIEVPRLYSMIIISNQEHFNTPQFFSNQKVTFIRKDIMFIKKHGLISFSQLIYKQNLWVLEIEKNLPEFGNIIETYAQHINSEDYLAEEKMISDFAINYIKKLTHNKDVPHIPNISGKVTSKDSQKNLENFRVKLRARRVLFGLYQLESSFLNHYKNNIEKWSVIYSLLQNGSLNKNVSSSTIQPFLSKHLIKVQTKKSYHWRDHYNIKLTPKEREWLLQYGKLIENNSSLI